MTKLHTTTVRFDVDTWEALCAEADRLGVHRAVYIREVTQVRLAGVPIELAALRARLEEAERRLELLTRAAWLVRREGHPQQR